jgi:hypothetical protein
MTISKVSEMPFNIISYPQFLTVNVDKLPFNKAEALGIVREDKYKKYKQWGSLNRIIQDSGVFISQSSYSPEIIIETLKGAIASND